MGDDTGSPKPEFEPALLRAAKPYRDGYAAQWNWRDRYAFFSRMLPSFLIDATEIAGEQLGYGTAQWAQDEFVYEYRPMVRFLARRTIERHPFEFLRLVTEHFAGFWYYALFEVPYLATSCEAKARREYFRRNEQALASSESVFGAPAGPTVPNAYAFRLPDRAERVDCVESFDETPCMFDRIQLVFRYGHRLCAMSTVVISLVVLALDDGDACPKIRCCPQSGSLPPC